MCRHVAMRCAMHFSLHLYAILERGRNQPDMRARIIMRSGVLVTQGSNGSFLRFLVRYVYRGLVHEN